MTAGAKDAGCITCPMPMPYSSRARSVTNATTISRADRMTIMTMIDHYHDRMVAPDSCVKNDGKLYTSQERVKEIPVTEQEEEAWEYMSESVGCLE